MWFVEILIAVCAFSAQVWAFRCWQELRKLNDRLPQTALPSAR